MPAAEFAQRLESIIAEAGITKTEFARRVFVTHPTVSKWLRGTMPRRSAVDAIRRRFNIAPDWLLAGVGPRQDRDEQRLADEKWVGQYLKQAVEFGEDHVADDRQYGSFLEQATGVADGLASIVSDYETLATMAEAIARRARQTIQHLNTQYHHKLRSLAVGAKSESRAEKTLQDTRQTVFLPAMGSHSVDSILDRVAAAADRMGGQRAAAASLDDMSPQQLNDWLSRRVTPGGQSLLRLLNWVDRQEGQNQKQGAGTASPVPAPDDPKEFNDEKTKSGRQRKSSGKAGRKTTKKAGGK